MKLDNISDIRKNFPVTRSKVFLNHAAYSPLPKPVVNIMREYNDELSRFEIDEVKYGLGKEDFARLVGAEEKEVALVQNTSTGLNIVANVLECPKGANVVTTDMEYPSVVYPWLNKKLGVEVRYVKNEEGKIPLASIEKNVDDQTIALAISHVEYVNGFKHDLKNLSQVAHENGAFLIVDAIQSLGVIPVDVDRMSVDFLTASCYKWLLGPAGAGYLYVRKELIERFDPPFIGWGSVDPEVFETIQFWDIRKLQLSNTASRFEIGSPSFVGHVGARAAIRLLLEVGIENIRKRILGLTELLMDSIENLGYQLTSPREPQHRSGIVHFLIEDAKKKAEKLKNKNIIVSARSNGLRISPHFYNTEEEIELLIKELKTM
jgi:selenocysteine lyase/cysteine desulfurase